MAIFASCRAPFLLLSFLKTYPTHAHFDVLLHSRFTTKTYIMYDDGLTDTHSLKGILTFISNAKVGLGIQDTRNWTNSITNPINTILSQRLH